MLTDFEFGCILFNFKKNGLICGLLLMLVLQVTLHASEQKGALDKIKIAKSFEDLFSYRGVCINLEEYDLIIGMIKKFNISKNGDFLLLDSIGKAVYLIKPNSKSAMEINPKAQLPGIPWDPQFISFAQDGYIYVISSPLSNT